MNILHRIQELEKLKSLLLTQDQLVLFNHLDKPTILEEELNRRHLTLVSWKQLKTKRRVNGNGQLTDNELLEAYKKLKSSRNRTDIDSRLLQVVEDEIKRSDEL